WGFRHRAPDVRLASLPTHHGWYAALCVLIPLVVFAIVWSVAAPHLVTMSVLASPEAENLPAFDLLRQTLLAEARAVASGAAQGVFNPDARPLIEPYREALRFYNWVGIAAVLAIGLAGGTFAFLR